MRKIVVKILLSVTLAGQIGCEQQILEKEPLDIISDAAVWNDEALVEAYLSNLYGRIEIPSLFRNLGESEQLQGNEAFFSDEATTQHAWHHEWFTNLVFGNLTSSNLRMKEYWAYDLLRDCNTFLKNIADGGVSENFKKTKSAEVRIIRAYTYFELVKRYGGVPLITEPQTLDGDFQDLFVPRNSEQEVYDFIAGEIDEVAEVLPKNTKNRFSTSAAYALKSRAMLYAGSIARYGKVQLDGLLGIPAGEADRYYQASYAASKKVIPTGHGGEGSGYTLYKDDIQSGDPASHSLNFYNLFVKEHTSESIFEINFIAGTKGNTASYSPWGYGSMMDPTVELANAFGKIDGSSGVIDYKNTAVASVPDLYADKDPRFNATFLNQGDSWKGGPVYANFFIIKENGEQVSTKGVFYTGNNGVTLPTRGEADTFTGFYQKKSIKDIPVPNWNFDDVPCLLFRLGEVYLNIAEAAFELGKQDEAAAYINHIRDRAGVARVATVSLNAIKNERRVELAFEAHRFWDLRRWRDAAKSPAEGGLNGLFLTKAQPYYDYREGKYRFDVGNVEALPRVFKEANYYLPIGIGRTNNNPNLIENPGY